LVSMMIIIVTLLVKRLEISFFRKCLSFRAMS
jgi:hypothetical protein